MGLREDEPLKITSSIDAPRRCLAEDSPMTQRTASMVLDLPHPLGPRMPVRLLRKSSVTGSTKLLNPAMRILLRRTGWGLTCCLGWGILRECVG